MYSLVSSCKGIDFEKRIDYHQLDINDIVSRNTFIEYLFQDTQKSTF